MKLKLAKMIQVTKEKPLLLCLTCGLATFKFVVRDKPDNSLWREKRKTWKRTIKTSNGLNRYRLRPGCKIYEWDTFEDIQSKMCKGKRIYQSYIHTNAGCFKKHHKLSVRYAPFSSKYISKLK